MLAVPLMLIVSLLMWYQAKEYRTNHDRLMMSRLQIILNEEISRIEDALTSFQIFAKSSYPMAILSGGDGSELNKITSDLELIKRGMDGIYLFGSSGELITQEGNALTRSERERVFDSLEPVNIIDGRRMMVSEAIKDSFGNVRGYLAAVIVPSIEQGTDDINAFKLSGTNHARSHRPECVVSDIAYRRQTLSLEICAKPAGAFIASYDILYIAAAMLLAGFVISALIARFIAISLQKPIMQLVWLSQILYLPQNIDERDVIALKLAKRTDEFGALTRALLRSHESAKILQDEKQKTVTMVAMGEIASHIAHDMRSPLSVLRAYVHMEEGDSTLTKSEFDETKAASKRSIDKLLRMANDLVDYSKASHLNKKVAIINDIVNEEVMAEVQCDGREHNVILCPTVDKKISACVDSDKIARAIVNLTNNAIHAVGGGGIIQIGADISGSNDLIIWVADNGKGIEPEYLPKIFDSFFTKGKKGGTGLGLAYCKQVVEAHGGTIGVESEVGKGTTFTIRIPDCVVNENTEPGTRNLEPGKAFPGALSPVPGPVSATRFLIVEDDPDIRAQWQRIVCESGGRVVYSAASADEMILKKGFNYKEVDTAIVDYHYEGFETNGVDLILYLKSKGVPRVHLCTGFHDDPEIQRRAHDAGADSVIGKPVDLASAAGLFDRPPDISPSTKGGA